MKTYEDCKKEVAQKHKLGNTLVTGHRAIYFQEAAELYAEQQVKTKEEILKQIEAIILAENCKAQNNTLDKAERIYELVKNSNIPAVMGELTCDSCGCHPNVVYTTSKGRFCERCKPAS